MDLDVLKLLDNLLEAAGKEDHLINRCIPTEDHLSTAIQKISDTQKNLIISTFSLQEYKTIFEAMYSFVSPAVDLPSDIELNLMVKAFQFIIKENQRQESALDTEDLKVLCLLYNVLCLQKDFDAFLKRYKNWKG